MLAREVAAGGNPLIACGWRNSVAGWHTLPCSTASSCACLPRKRRGRPRLGLMPQHLLPSLIDGCKTGDGSTCCTQRLAVLCVMATLLLGTFTIECVVSFGSWSALPFRLRRGAQEWRGARWDTTMFLGDSLLSLNWPLISNPALP
jgi:hypothetical protein